MKTFREPEEGKYEDVLIKIVLTLCVICLVMLTVMFGLKFWQTL